MAFGMVAGEMKVRTFAWNAVKSLLIAGPFLSALCWNDVEAANPAGSAPTHTGASMYYKTHKSAAVSSSPVLIVVLHGDAPFHKPSVQYRVAERFAREMDDVVVVGMLRPGYSDPLGNRSPGRRGLTTGDNYTADSMARVGDAMRSLKKLHMARSVVVVGHSGGAAVAANLLGVEPGLVNHAVLVACPCDVTRFRSHMRSRTWNPVRYALWSWPANSLSPIDLVPRIASETRIAVIVGSDDDVTPRDLSIAYANLAGERGLDVELAILEGRDHEIFEDPAVLKAVRKLVDP